MAANPTRAASHLFVLCLFVLIGSTGCRWFANNKSKDNHFIHRTSILFDRIDNGSSARLAFKTASPAFCKLRLWSQEKDKNPSAANPRETPCANKNPQTDFVELISGLSLDTLYVVEIIAWQPPQSSNNGDRVKVYENDGNGAGKNLFVVRLNSPLHTAELHRYSNPQPVGLDQLKASLQMDTGCHANEDRDSLPYSKASSFELEEVSSVGYAVAEPVSHPRNREIKRLNFNNYHPEQSWRFVLGEGAEQFSFSALPAGELHEVLAIQNTTTRIEKSTLNHPATHFLISPQSPVELQWSTNTNNLIAYILVQVGHHNQEGGFSCVFNAADASGLLPAEPFLANLAPNKTYDTTVTLYTAQVQLFPSQGKPTWLITSFDWRIATLERRT